MQSTCVHCGAQCSKDKNDNHSWFCNCVSPCVHIVDQGSGWYYSTRRERTVVVQDVGYFVWADNPVDAIVKLNESGMIRKERFIHRTIDQHVEPESEWGPVSYDFNEGMGR